MTLSIFARATYKTASLVALTTLCTLACQPNVWANQQPGDNQVSTPALSGNPEVSKEPKGEIKNKAIKFFEDYKQKDQNSDPSLINLYAADAAIYSGIERERGGVLFDKMDRATFASQMALAIKDPHIKELNKTTVYHEPKINHINREGEAVALQFSFKATRAKSGIKVHWLLRESKDGSFEIYDEHSISYRLKVAK